MSDRVAVASDQVVSVICRLSNPLTKQKATHTQVTGPATMTINFLFQAFLVATVCSLAASRLLRRSLAAPDNYCGLTWTDAAQCTSLACPNGLDSECPPGETCYTCTGELRLVRKLLFPIQRRPFWYMTLDSDWVGLDSSVIEEQFGISIPYSLIGQCSILWLRTSSGFFIGYRIVRVCALSSLSIVADRIGFSTLWSSNSSGVLIGFST